jgi:endonuclease YncB( thermonuclease family)
VKDGDSLEVSAADVDIEIRLAEVDCPEWNQPYGREATSLTTRLANRKRVALRYKDIDHYDRVVAWVTLPDGTDLSRELLRQGAAHHYRKYSTHEEELDRIESQARQEKRGLWALPNPIYPEDWRHGKR